VDRRLVGGGPSLLGIVRTERGLTHVPKALVRERAMRSEERYICRCVHYYSRTQ